VSGERLVDFEQVDLDNSEARPLSAFGIASTGTSPV